MTLRPFLALLPALALLIALPAAGRERVELIPEEVAALNAGTAFAPLTGFFLGGPGYWYRAREIQVETVPPGAVLDLFYVRASFQKAYEQADAPITFFQDDARNAFKGTPFDVNDRGWAGGNGSARAAVIQALSNHYDEEPLSTDGISYLDIHDNWALADRYASNGDHNGLEGVDMAAMRIAAGLLLTSAGPVVIHGGTEMLRSKGLAPHEEHEVEVAGGPPIHFKGRDDTYNVRAPNRFLWDSLAPGSDAVAMRDFWRGLLALRMSEHGSVFRVADVPEGHYRWIAPPEETLLGYVVGERVLVLANSGVEDGIFGLELPEGDWLQVVGRYGVDLDGIPSEYASIPGGPHDLRVQGGSFLVWVRK